MSRSVSRGGADTAWPADHGFPGPRQQQGQAIAFAWRPSPFKYDRSIPKCCLLQVPASQTVKLGSVQLQALGVC